MMRRSEKRYAFIQSELNDSVMKSGVFHQMSEKFSRSTDVFTTANGGGGLFLGNFIFNWTVMKILYDVV